MASTSFCHFFEGPGVSGVEMKKVIVTGAAGFIGRQTLQPLLESGYEIHAVDLRKIEDFAQKEINWHQIDLNDKTSVNNLLKQIAADDLLHFAWFTRHGEYWSSAENFKSLFASFNLLEAFAENGGNRVVISGSCAEYAWNNKVCDEQQSLLAPATIYGQCKLAMYNLLQAYAAVHNLSWAWGRLFFLFGPYENKKRYVSSVINSLLKREAALCSHGMQIRDFMSTIDAAHAFVALLQSDVQGAVNIASGEPKSLKDIALIIGKYLDSENLLKFGARSAATNDSEKIVANCYRLHNEVGWTSASNLQQRLLQTIDWWRNNE
jgi:nucleoside-diphosphate-sugar epimerase